MELLWAGLILLGLFILTGGFFAAAQAALRSARRPRVDALAHKGHRRAVAVVGFLEQPETYIATAQSGVRLAAVLAGATGGMLFMLAFTEWIVSLPSPALRIAAGVIAFGVISLAVAWGSIFLGDSLPKILVAKNPERWALRLAWPMGVFIRLGTSSVRFLSASGGALTRDRQDTGNDTAEGELDDDVSWLVREGRRKGLFDQTESELVAQVFSFAQTQVRRAMTPRTDIAAISTSWPREQALRFIASEGYSRYPVYEDSLDRIIGLVHTKDVITVLMSGGVVIFEDLVRPAMFVPDSQKLGPLLRRMQKEHEHMAIVLDEFGGTAGLVTLEDLLEEIVGDIRDEHDDEAPEFFMDDRTGRARIAGKMPIDEFNEALGVALDDRLADTVAGFIVRTLGRVPGVGEKFDAGPVHFRVLTVRDNRIELLEGVKQHPAITSDNKQNGSPAGG